MLRILIDSILKGNPAPISFEDLYTVSLAVFRIEESLRTENIIEIK